MERWLAPVLLVSTSSCFDPHYRDTRCSPAGECPSGYRCENEVCIDRDAPLTDARPDASADASEAADAPEAPDARLCPGMYMDFGVPGSRYHLDFEKNWLDAERACESAGAGIHLVIVDSIEERDALRPNVTTAVWIGLTDRVNENDFIDVTGMRPTFQPWATGEPNDLPPGEDCVELDAAGFNDNPCGQIQAFVCECDGRVPDPASHTPAGS
jgi:hypothetical protein